MIHLVFEPSGAGVLQKSFELEEDFGGETVIIKDDYAVGPVAQIYEPEGWQARKTWWEEVLQYSPYTDQLEMADDKLTVHQLKKKLEEDTAEKLWIWMGQNPHDVCGYYWLITQLAEFEGRIFVLYLNNLPFINEAGSIFYPTHLQEIQPKEFLKARKLARPVTLSEFELDPDEWHKLCTENTLVRILEGGKKIVSEPETYYDKEILEVLGDKTVRLPRLLTNIFSRLKTATGDVFIVWRLRKLVEAGRLLCEGDWNKGWKDILLKDTKGEMFVEMEKTEDQ